MCPDECKVMNGPELSALYKNRFPQKQLQRKNDIWKVLCRCFFQKFIKSSYTVIDIGCGYGEFLNNISAKKKIALDLNPDAKLYLEPNIDFYNREATDFGLFLTGIADIVFTSNFFGTPTR